MREESLHQLNDLGIDQAAAVTASLCNLLGNHCS